MPVQLRPAQVDFSMLAKLPELFQQARQTARQNAFDNAFSDPSSYTTGGQFDPQKAAQLAFRYGKPEVGISLLTNSVNPVTGEVYSKFGTTPAATSQGTATTEDAATAGMNPAEKQKYLEAKAGAQGKAAGEGQQTPEEVKGNITQNLKDLAYYYRQLDEEGASVDPNQPDTWRNVRARFGASPIGGAVEGTIGTKAQQTRDNIKTLQTSLIDSIRKVTGMSARAMDSNVELKFQIQQATDPSFGREANYAAIRRLARTYGLGNIDSEIPPDVLSKMPDMQTGSAPKSINVEEGQTVYDPQGRPHVIRNGVPVPVGQ